MPERDPCVIGIDCPPGEPRPDELFPGILRDSGLSESDFESPTTLFGAWTWQLKDAAKEAVFLARPPLFRRRLRALLRERVIRGAVIEPGGLAEVKAKF